METQIKTFANFVSEMMHHKEEILRTFEISEETLNFWASGNHSPSVFLRNSVWEFLNHLQSRDLGFVKDNSQLFSEIVEIVNRKDPIGLLKIGAPQDEYHGEVEKIIYCLRREKTLHDFRLAVWAIFVYRFDVCSTGPTIYYNEMSEAIWNLKIKA